MEELELSMRTGVMGGSGAEALLDLFVSGLAALGDREQFIRIRFWGVAGNSRLNGQIFLSLNPLSGSQMVEFF